MHSNEELNNGKASGLIGDEGGKKNSADFSSKNANKMKTQSSPPEKNNLEAKNKAKKKAKGIAKIFTTFATVISASLIGIAGLNIFLPPAATVKAEIEQIYTTESEVYYFVTLDNFNETDDVYVVLYNDFTNRSQKAESPEFDGGFENLQKDMSYTLEVRQGDVIIASKVVRTVFDRQIDNPEGGQTDPTQGDDDNTNEPIQDDPIPGDATSDPTQGSGNTNDNPTGTNTSTNGNG